MKNIKTFESFIVNTEKYHVWSDSLGKYVTIYGKENLENLNKELEQIVIQSFPKKTKYDPIKEREIFLKYEALKESHDHENYMFFNNLEGIKRMAEEILSMDHEMIDQKLSNGHDWATDHISVAAENLEHVYNFFMNNEDGHEHQSMEEHTGCQNCDCNPCECN
jgi:hypothetical protein